MTKTQEEFMKQLRQEGALLVTATNKTALALEKQGIVKVDRRAARVTALAFVTEVTHDTTDEWNELVATVEKEVLTALRKLVTTSSESGYFRRNGVLDPSHCGVTQTPCPHYSYQLDGNLDVVTCFCGHQNNPSPCEGNATKEICPLRCCPATQAPCRLYTFVADYNGRVVFEHCTHEGNIGGECTKELCPLTNA